MNTLHLRNNHFLREYIERETYVQAWKFFLKDGKSFATVIIRRSEKKGEKTEYKDKNHWNWKTRYLKVYDENFCKTVVLK